MRTGSSRCWLPKDHASAAVRTMLLLLLLRLLLVLFVLTSHHAGFGSAGAGQSSLHVATHPELAAAALWCPALLNTEVRMVVLVATAPVAPADALRNRRSRSRAAAASPGNG